MIASTPKTLRQRKFFLWLPVFVIPVVTVFFVLLGGRGTVNGSALLTNVSFSGLNPALPDAHNTEHPTWTKLDFYKQADADSARRKQLRARDPYYSLHELTVSSTDSNRLLPVDRAPSADVAAAKLMRKLDQLNQQLQRPVEHQAVGRKTAGASAPSPEVSKLETLLRSASANKETPDPEMEQLHGMLDKIYAIQHPGITEQQWQDSVKRAAPAVFTVGVPDSTVITILRDTTASLVTGNGFYSIGESVPESPKDNAIAAIIADNQTLVNGSIVKLRLSQDVVINERSIPADQLIYGTAHLTGERLEILITSIRIGQQLLPVKLLVYDLDGLPGIAIPGGIARDVLKQSAGQSMQNIGMLSVDPSVGAQAATAGIQAAKTVLHKKMQVTKVELTSGYAVLLLSDELVH